MLRNNRSLVVVLLAVAVSLVSAYIASGSSYLYDLTPKRSLGRLQGVSSDGWAAKESSITFPGVPAFINRLSLEFNSWRPGGAAVLMISVCGVGLGEFAVLSNDPIKLKFPQSCDPLRVDLKVKNPFVPGNGDTRELGVRLVQAKITSKLGIPLSSTKEILDYFFPIFILTLLAVCLFAKFALPLSVLAPIVTAFFLGRAAPQDFANLTVLWILLACLLAGGQINKLFRENELPKVSRKTFSPEFLILIVILIVAAGLRFYGISFGLPALFHPDETPKINAINRMIQSGTFNPEYFLHPSLLLYLTYFMNKFIQWVGYPGEFQETLRLSGRFVSAIAGTGTVALLYYIGRILYAPAVGLFAAGLLAVLPLHVTCSRYMKEDALMLFFVLAVVLSVANAVKKNSPKYIVLASIFAGFATGVKYSGFLSCAIVCSAPWMASRSFIPDRRFLKWLIPSLVLVPIFFVITTPYSVLDFDKFANGFSNERKHMLKGHTVSISAWSQYWMYHLRRSAFPGMQTFTTLASLVALGFFAFRRKIEDLYIIALVLFFYMPAEWVRAKPAPQPERYILPCLPFLALALAEMTRVLSSKIPRALIAAFVVALVSLPFYRSIRLTQYIYTDTRIQMSDWIRQNIPKGSKILIDWQPYAPTLPKNEYVVSPFPSGGMIKGLRLEELKRNGFDYLILSSLVYDRFFSQPQTDAVRRTIIKRVFDAVPVVKHIVPDYQTYGFHNPTLTLFSIKDFAKMGSPLPIVVAEEEPSPTEAKASLNDDLDPEEED